MAKDMNTIITTRMCNPELYAKSSAFWPKDIPRLPIQGLNGWREAADYLWQIIQLDADLVVNCDEDCFIFNWGVVEELMQHMRTLGIAYAGMPDIPSNCPHRRNSYRVHNPFFTIYDPRAIRAAIPKQPSTDVHLEGTSIHEPFNGLYNMMYNRLLHYNLSGRTHHDGISTALCWEGRPFALHSWYAREYGTSHRLRINNLYAEALARFNTTK